MLLLNFPLEICVQRDISCPSRNLQPRCPAGCCQLSGHGAGCHLPASTGKAFSKPVVYFFLLKKRMFSLKKTFTQENNATAWI